jgi:hypothetical protein
MAIDTAAKRKSVSGILTALTIVGVTADATPGPEWRQTAGWGYEGISTSPPPAFAPTLMGAADVYGIPAIAADVYGIPWIPVDVYGDN